MVELIRKVAASSDDCYRGWWPPEWYLAFTGQQAGANSPTIYQQGGGMRFLNITIPKGAIITAAYLILRSTWGYVGTVVNTKISGEAVDNAPTFADDKDEFDARWYNNTIAKVEWDNIPAWAEGEYYNSPDIKAVIQEIIDRAGWASGNAIVIFWEDFDDRSTHANGCMRVAASYDYYADWASQLYIEYTVPPPPKKKMPSWALPAGIVGFIALIALIAKGRKGTMH